ncbi:leucine-rich repeat domain-containing protein [Wolbachia endosymbiont (group A) of Lasioglossum morio]|uniref:hypothetical protein n=1 Tax=Wolbachia endosymbiont (group A) of Lasioglossum morio TaxID=2954025 RepID=UPI002226C35E|nr:hypothetical protein [Wolbachia endosymbiont (group A) of Lasioglossum morio]
MRLYGKLDPSVSYSDDRRGDWDSKRRILKRQTSKKTYVKSSINENYTFFMHAMVFIINGECDMALGDQLNAKTEQELIDDGAFINALVEKLAAGVGNSGVYTKTAANTAFVKTDGSNATEAGVTAMLGTLRGNNQVVKANGDNATEAGVTAMLGTLKGNNQVVKANGDNATEDGVNAMLDRLTGDNVVAKIDGSNVEEAGVNAMLGKLTDKVVKVPDLITKVNVLGDNATEAGVKAMLDKLSANEKVAKVSDLTTKVNVAGDNVTDAGVNAMLDKLTDKVVKATELKTKAAEKEVVDAITASSDFTNKVYIKAAPADEVYTKTVTDTTFAKIDASNLTDAANKKAFAEAILPAQDGDKSILVDKLGDAIASTDKAEYNVGTEQTAKQFLNSRGLIPSEDAIFTRLTSNDNFKTSVAMNVNASDTGFQNAVREVMSQPRFEIPGEADVPISADW